MRTTAERLAAAKQRARELERERQRRRARGMILQRFGIEQFCARAIGEHEPVRRRPVMVGRGEALIMQPSRAARSQHNGFRASD